MLTRPRSRRAILPRTHHGSCSLLQHRRGHSLDVSGGWWVAGWWEVQFAVKAAFVVWLAYALIDISVLVAAGGTTMIAVLFAVSFLTKLAAVYLGALVGSRRA